MGTLSVLGPYSLLSPLSPAIRRAVPAGTGADGGAKSPGCRLSSAPAGREWRCRPPGSGTGQRQKPPLGAARIRRDWGGSREARPGAPVPRRQAASSAKAAEGPAQPRGVPGDRPQVGCRRQLGGAAAAGWDGHVQRLFESKGDLQMIQRRFLLTDTEST